METLLIDNEIMSYLQKHFNKAVSDIEEEIKKIKGIKIPENYSDKLNSIRVELMDFIAEWHEYINSAVPKEYGDLTLLEIELSKNLSNATEGIYLLETKIENYLKQAMEIDRDPEAKAECISNYYKGYGE